MKLTDYPCPVGIDLMCNSECAEAVDACEAVVCLWLPVYRQAIADHKCARLLRVLDRRYVDHLLMFVVARLSTAPLARGLECSVWRVRSAINGALREAGLL